MVNLNVAKPPPIKTGAELKREKEQEALKDLIDFDLSKEFDQDTYLGRFYFQLSRLNPLLFFHTNGQIKEAHDLVTRYKLRLEAAKNMG